VAKASAYQFKKWEARLLHINLRRQGVPEGTLAWTEEYFAKSPHVQRLLGLHNALKPEVETAVQVMDRLKRMGVTVRNGKTK